jgi:hypothetical protein
MWLVSFIGFSMSAITIRAVKAYLICPFHVIPTRKRKILSCLELSVLWVCLVDQIGDLFCSICKRRSSGGGERNRTQEFWSSSILEIYVHY